MLLHSLPVRFGDIQVCSLALIMQIMSPPYRNQGNPSDAEGMRNLEEGIAKVAVTAKDESPPLNNTSNGQTNSNGGARPKRKRNRGKGPKSSQDSKDIQTSQVSEGKLLVLDVIT